MKTLKYLTLGMVISFSLIMASCSKDDPQTVDLTKGILGTYNGSLTEGILKNSVDATADITRIDDAKIQIHCYSSVLDTTFNMELFENGDSLMVCDYGEDFTMHYGHARMGGHHMGDDPDAHSWMHHMSEDHQAGEEHFGGFDMQTHNFNYRFVLSNNSVQLFAGTKL